MTVFKAKLKSYGHVLASEDFYKVASGWLCVSVFQPGKDLHTCPCCDYAFTCMCAFTCSCIVSVYSRVS